MAGGVPSRSPNPPQITDASLNNNTMAPEDSTNLASPNDIVIQPVINFNGMQQVGYVLPPSKEKHQ